VWQKLSTVVIVGPAPMDGSTGSNQRSMPPFSGL
jgi:hypothetical protein